MNHLENYLFNLQTWRQPDINVGIENQNGKQMEKTINTVLTYLVTSFLHQLCKTKYCINLTFHVCNCMAIWQIAEKTRNLDISFCLF